VALSEKWRTNAALASFICGLTAILLAVAGIVHWAIVQEHFDPWLAIAMPASLLISLLGLIVGAFGVGPRRNTALMMCACILVLVFGWLA
jgi:hypothetical protein